MSRPRRRHDGRDRRQAPLEMTPAAVPRRSAIGWSIRSPSSWTAVPDGPVTRDESPADVRAALGASAPLPERGTDARLLLDEARELLFDHSLFNGHPRFFGYITSSPAPIGMLGDLLAAAVNPNVGAWALSPMATEIEAQTVRWIAELIGYPGDCGGLLVSGGNMANFVCFLAARAAKARRWDVPRAWRRGAGAAACLRVGGNPHLDPEGRRPVRPRHRRDPLDSRPTPSSAWTSPRCARRSREDRARGDGRSWSSAPPAR